MGIITPPFFFETPSPGRFGFVLFCNDDVAAWRLESGFFSLM